MAGSAYDRKATETLESRGRSQNMLESLLIRALPGELYGVAGLY